MRDKKGLSYTLLNICLLIATMGMVGIVCNIFTHGSNQGNKNTTFIFLSAAGVIALYRTFIRKAIYRKRLKH